ncbi:CitMHS family citrate-Mg2+:H+ or citrate-Ca2+:H+ symporter [Algoriphagus iocasae]|uniref:CitMHS family citrate-Mg2+:H+ or citrate-Ca2+:H+ symporter n=1 Tax=Algoriphagus iocasae TaxID=1836499 RepID=A0A841MGM2_9BACT|nr:citrate:proton symporter [Algoriphagus iocasae]MBB6324637.1 CitMHS family citrate-Mg2+:H+ or citrate-Ca2+:H+ symporter [Algoriphagus iocasae]
MLAIWGLITIVLLFLLVLGKKVSPVIALILIPVATGILAGFWKELPSLIGEGLISIAPTGLMFIFAILFFGILLDAGTFDPIIDKLLSFAGNDPLKIVIATAILAMLIHLDGSGAVTFLITIPALSPVYDKMNMSRLTLASIVALAAGTMNILPWGGPTLRAATALNISVTELFNPILVPVLVGLATVLAIAYKFGMQERKNINFSPDSHSTPTHQNEVERKSLNPILFWFNILTVIIAIGSIIMSFAPPHIVFMIAFAITLLVNYPKVSQQRERIDSHAKEAMLMASILFAAGCFTGILKGTGMIEAMASEIVHLIPSQVGREIPLITGIFAMPASLLFDPDSFYFGILPLLSTTAEHFQASGLEVGRAAILGQMTTGFAVSPLTGSTFLLIGLAGVELGEHQKKTIPWAFLITLIMVFVSVLIGAISI